MSYVREILATFWRRGKTDANNLQTSSRSLNIFKAHLGAYIYWIESKLANNNQYRILFPSILVIKTHFQSAYVHAEWYDRYTFVNKMNTDTYFCLSPSRPGLCHLVSSYLKWLSGSVFGTRSRDRDEKISGIRDARNLYNGSSQHGI